MQVTFILLLILMKYVAPLTRYKMKSTHIKIIGSLILTQALILHKETQYSELISDFSLPLAVDTLDRNLQTSGDVNGDIKKHRECDGVF